MHLDIYLYYGGDTLYIISLAASVNLFAHPVTESLIAESRVVVEVVDDIPIKPTPDVI